MISATALTCFVAQSGGVELVDGRREDWLLGSGAYQARIELDPGSHALRLDNGLVRREWRFGADGTAACVALDDLMSGASLLRAVRPEAELVLDGVRYPVGGLVGQPDHAFLLPEWLEDMQPPDGAFRFVGWQSVETVERFPWKRVRPHAPRAAWPPPGRGVRLDFAAPEGAGLDGLSVSVHYELYDGIPAMQKWLTIHNGTRRRVEIDRVTCEILAVVEHSNHVEYRDIPLPPPDSLHVETDYAFGGFNHGEANRFAVHWGPDPEYLTQVNYLRRNPCLLRVEPTRGPDQLLEPGETFESFRTFELVQDSTDRERRGLALRRMYRTVAPWVTENPLILHVVSTDRDVVRTAIDQAAECGFEMVSLSFGSGLSMENESAANLQKFRELSAYAERAGIHLGGYSLLSSRRIGNGQDVVPPEDESPTHGSCPALTSEWGQDYFRKLERFFEETGFLQFTHDGSYPGDFDVTARPPLQRGLDDSQWAQWRVITEFYQRQRARGVYLRVPDYYYLSGSNECGMGYRETNWSLPRDLQVIHTRQNIYDGTWEKTPSMGWMFVPLTQYHGGGAAATIEPLDEHLDHYERMLSSNLGMGVQAVYRGTRLYDTQRVRDAVRKWVDWYREYRDILESDLIHGRRADGRDLDWMLHVNPSLPRCGMLVVWNPLGEEVSRTLQVPLYYTGLRDVARVRVEGGDARIVALDPWSRAEMEVRVPARGFTWILIEKT